MKYIYQVIQVPSSGVLKTHTAGRRIGRVGKLHLVSTIDSRQITQLVLINLLTQNTLLKLQHPNLLSEFVTVEGFMNVNFYVIT